MSASPTAAPMLTDGLRASLDRAQTQVNGLVLGKAHEVRLAFVALLSGIDPAFLPRCLSSVQGKAILAAAAVLQALGWLTIRKILSVRA